MLASVIIPTHNRPRKLARLLECLRDQDASPAGYEIVVVDDNSQPPATAPRQVLGPEVRVVRLDKSERSATRNTGAALARGEILIFLDDDMKVGREFVSSHLDAQGRHPGALVVGSVRLPEEALATPFGRFRQRLEDVALPAEPGPTAVDNLCTAANMSIARIRFLEGGGFDRSISSSEDQDFAIRHSAVGRQIVFEPAAKAVHCDDALDIRRYCRRSEWGSAEMIPFCRRYPDRPDNVHRHRVNGPINWRGEPVTMTMRKLAKAVLATTLVRESLFGIGWLLERVEPGSRALDRVYRLLLGAHIFRGYRSGLKRYAASDRQTARKAELAAGSSAPQAGC